MGNARTAFIAVACLALSFSMPASADFARRAVGCACRDWQCWDRLVNTTSTSSFLCAATALMAAAGVRFPMRTLVTVARCLGENVIEGAEVLGRIRACAGELETKGFINCLVPARGKVDVANSVMSCVQSGPVTILSGYLTALSCGLTLARGTLVLGVQGRCLYSDIKQLLESRRAVARACARAHCHDPSFLAHAGSPDGSH